MTVAIIGGGFSGLVCAKEAKACGLNPTVFERAPGIGGLWNPETGATWDKMHTNISHYTTCFSDFPWEEGTQDFPTAPEVHRYLERYADHFELSPHIQLSTEVKKVEQVAGKWVIKTQPAEGSRSQAFDHLIVASGFFSTPYSPSIPGQESFPGTRIHSSAYRGHEPFAGKTVVVIGNAFSGCEIVSSVAQAAERVIHLQRSPKWILPRYFKVEEEKIPCDLRFYSRAADARSAKLDAEAQNSSKIKWFRTTCARQAELSEHLRVPEDPTAPSFSVISDTYLDAVGSRRVNIVTGTVERIEGDHLHLADRTSVQADAIIDATGYRSSLPFLDPSLLEKISYAQDDPLQPYLLADMMFVPNEPSIIFVGMYRGPFPAVIELQARRACMTFAGVLPFPDAEEAGESIAQEKRIREARPRPQFPHPNYVGLCEEYAEKIGVRPDYSKLQEAAPELYNHIWEGPFTPASYRLGVPGAPTTEQALSTIHAINHYPGHP